MAPVLSVLEYYLVNYRRVWRASVLTSFVLPLLTVVGFGLGVGSYVTGGIDGFSYLDWMIPGLIASTAMQIAIGEATWPVFGSFEWDKIYYSQAAAPLRVADILGGHLLFITLRVLASVGAFLAVAGLFGALHSWWAPVSMVVAALLCVAVATPTFAYAASIDSDSYLSILFRLGLVPMSLFSGIFFPVDSLPAPLEWLARALPLWHAVDLTRAATLGVAPEGWGPGHVLYLLVWCAVGWWLAQRRFRNRLVV
jgi:lipooligosaccharide transport system permease protein